MKIERAKNATRNVAVGAVLRLPNIIYAAVFHNRDEFKQTIRLADNIVGKKSSCYILFL